MKKSGFTLAEVLITLAIIGVVASLTIPTVVRNYQKQQTVTQLKKVYNALANTTSLTIANEGPVSGWEVEENGSAQFANRYLLPYLKVAKNCENKTTPECSFKYSVANGASSSYGSNYTRFYLNDGALIAILVRNFQSEELFYKYTLVIVDINGQKKPNLVGRDIFYFRHYIHYGTDDHPVNGKFMPYGYTWNRGDLVARGCGAEQSYTLCAALIMKDGWQIADDYPW